MCGNRLVKGRLRRAAHAKMIAVIESAGFDLQTVKADREIHRAPSFLNVECVTRDEAGAFFVVIFPRATSERSQERSLLVSVSNLGFAENNEAVKHLVIVDILVIREVPP